jgi:hypothetical protein
VTRRIEKLEMDVEMLLQIENAVAVMLVIANRAPRHYPKVKGGE